MQSWASEGALWRLDRDLVAPGYRYCREGLRALRLLDCLLRPLLFCVRQAGEDECNDGLD